MILHAADFRKNNPTLSDSEVLQMMFDTQASTYYLTGLTFNLTQTVYYPKDAQVIGQGATINGTTYRDFDLLAPEGTKGLTVAQILQRMGQPYFEGINFRDGRNQLQIVGTTKWGVNRCNFIRGVRGIQGIFAMGGNVQSCEFMQPLREAFVVRSGISDGPNSHDDSSEKWFTNATANNSQSNVGSIQNCRFFSRPDQFCNLRIDGSSNWSLRDLVFEGANPDYDIYFNSRGSSTVVDVSMENLHIEHGCQIAHIFIQGGRRATIARLYKQAGQDGVIIEGQGHGQIIIDRLTSAPTAGQIWKSSQQKEWVFRDCSLSRETAFSQEKWEGARPREIAFHWLAQMSATGQGARMLGYGPDESLIMAVWDQVRIQSNLRYNMGEKPLVNPVDLKDFKIIGLERVRIPNPEGQNGTQLVYVPLISPL